MSWETILLMVRSGGRSLSLDCAAIVALCQELGGWCGGIVGKPSDAPRQRNLARRLHEWNRAVRIISTMAIGLQRASPSIGRCSVVDVVVVELVRQGSNSMSSAQTGMFPQIPISHAKT